MSSTAKLTTALAALVLAATALAGCTNSTPESTAAATSTPAPATTTTSATPDPFRVEPEQAAPDAGGMPLLDRCDPNQGDVMADDAIINDTLQLRPFENMRDLGATENAAGEVTFDDEGALASYVVAPGDAVDAIQQRFCMDSIMFEALNAVRRAPGWLSGGAGSSLAIYAGDTLNLSPYTITSVGDENGTVYDNQPTFRIPEQR